MLVYLAFMRGCHDKPKCVLIHFFNHRLNAFTYALHQFHNIAISCIVLVIKEAERPIWPLAGFKGSQVKTVVQPSDDACSQAHEKMI